MEKQFPMFRIDGEIVILKKENAEYFWDKN